MMIDKLGRALRGLTTDRSGVATLEYGIMAAIVTAFLLPSFSAYTNGLQHMMVDTTNVLMAHLEQAQRCVVWR